MTTATERFNYRGFWRFGISNVLLSNGYAYAQQVLKINEPLVYGQQLMHNTVDYSGPHQADTQFCGSPDNDSWNRNIIRQVSPADGQYSRKNLSNYLTHRSNNYEQIYYFGNEPDIPSSHQANGYNNQCTIGSAIATTLWQARDLSIDPAASYTGGPNSFWWNGNGINYNRIHPIALAEIYANCVNDNKNYWYSYAHILIPPTTRSTDFSLVVNGIARGLDGDDASLYWKQFYEKVHSMGVSPQDIGALHLHYYSFNSGDSPQNTAVTNANILKAAVDWYVQLVKNKGWQSDTVMRTNILISETGQLFVLPPGKSYWFSGFSTLLKGLNWWNTYLCYLARSTRSHFNLAGDVDVYACMHDAHNLPCSLQYIPANGSPATASKGQTYCRLVAGQTGYVITSVNAYEMDINLQPLESSGVGSWTRQVSAIDTAASNGSAKAWLRTPYGACMYVWNTTGEMTWNSADRLNLNVGWAQLINPGEWTSEVQIYVPPGLQTLYVPCLKAPGSFQSANNLVKIGIQFKLNGTIVPMQTYNGNANSHNYNWASIAEDFEDGNSWTVLSAQIYPFCVFTPNGGWISYSFTRQGSAGKPSVWVGQAQILQGWCSWRTVS